LGPIYVDFVFRVGGAENVGVFEVSVSFLGLVGGGKAYEAEGALDLGVFFHEDAGDIAELIQRILYRRLQFLLWQVG